jgi:hypothetical protein
MESGEMPPDQSYAKQREQELYQRWERIVNASFARYDHSIHSGYHKRRSIRLLFFTGYWLVLSLWITLILDTTTTIPNEPVEEKKPVKDTKIMTHYDQWNVRRREYFNEKDKCTEFPEKVK